MKIAINKIKPDPNQPRKIFDSKHIDGLAKNLKIEGMINPIEIDKKNMIITGECRWRAAKEAGWKEVPVNVYGNGISKYERFRRQMAENLHQSAAGSSSPMNPMDVAKGYKQLIEMQTKKDYVPGTLSRDEVYGVINSLSTELGVDEHTIWEYLKLLEKPEYVMEDISKGTPRTFYREIDRAPDKWREKLQKAVSEKKIDKRNDLARFARVARTEPDKAAAEFHRLTKRNSEVVNRVLNRSIELNMALKQCMTADIDRSDRRMLLNQLDSTQQAIKTFLSNRFSKE